MSFLLIIIGKIISKLSSTFNLGSGSTWPGHIALSINKNFIKDLINKNSQLKIVLIAGTNGKTTTGKLIQTILKTNGKKVFQNEAGANLLNGIASSLITNSNILGKINKDFGIFEIDENTLHLITDELTPNYVILLNLFRDQLDRYGEVDTIAKKWGNALDKLPDKTTLILNADDPQIAFLGEKKKTGVFYFGLNDKTKIDKEQETLDTNYCPKCNAKLTFKAINFAHLGNWQCSSCKLQRPKLDIEQIDYYPLPGIYNKYNSLAAVLFSKLNGIDYKKIIESLKKFTPAFGRQEVFNVRPSKLQGLSLESWNEKRVQIFLSKNPTSFNESLRTIKELKAENLLLVLNDRIPDGRDVSWIWDTNVEGLLDSKNVVVSGDRAFDMGLRLKYAQKTSTIEENLRRSINSALEQTPKGETLYILPTYTAMLEVRKILTGRKIL